MDMGMVLQDPSPGMQHAGEARQMGADVLWIFDKFFNGAGSGLEHGAIGRLLI